MENFPNFHRFQEVITELYLLLMLTVYLLFCSGGYQTLVRTKFTLFCLLCGAYLLAMTVVGLLSLRYSRLPSPMELLRRSSRVQRMVLLYLMLSWCSALLSPHFPTTILGASRYEGALTISLYCLSFLLVSVYGRTTPALLYAAGGSAVLFGLLSLVQLLGLNPLGLYPQGMNYYDANVRYSGAYLGTIGNVDFVAAYLCLMLPVFWVALLRLRNRHRFWLLLPLALLLAVLMKISVQAGLVGVFGGVVLSLPVVLPARRSLRLRLAACLAAGTAAALLLLYTTDFGSGLPHELHALLHGQAQGSFGSGRIRIWRSVLDALPEHLWLGAGPDSMILAGFPPFTRYDQTYGLIVSQIDAAHNEYLNILYHQGLLGLLPYLAALVLLARQWILRSADDSVAAILGAAALGYGIQAFFGISMCLTAPYFWLTLALLEQRSHHSRPPEYLP